MSTWQAPLDRLTERLTRGLAQGFALDFRFIRKNVFFFYRAPLLR